MKHPDLESLVRMSRTGSSSESVADHLAACADCTDTVAWASDVRAAAAAVTSLRAPTRAWAQIESRLERSESVVLPVASQTTGRRARVAAIAAGLVLMASVGAALVPQTGFRTWVERHLFARSEPVPPAESASALEASTTATGLVLQLVDGAFHIELTSPAAPLLVRLQLTDGADVEVSATGSAASARFLAGRGRLEIAGAAGGEVTLLLPRFARLIRVNADGSPAVELRNGRLTVHAVEADTMGTEVLLPFR